MTMKVGMNLPVMVPGLTRDVVRRWCERIDDGPFSSIAAGERITFPNPEIMVTLSHAAAWTERVAVGFHVLVPPMHDAVLLAKQVATLDVLSGGRVCLGVGVGAREEDYRAVGAAWDSRLLTRMEESVHTMRAVWNGNHVVDGATRPVEPCPLQAGGPPLLAGVLMPQAIARVARWADGITGFSFGPSREDVEMRFEGARRAWKEAGRSSRPYLATGFWFALGKDADEQVASYLERYLAFMGADAGRALAPNILAKSPAAMRDALKMCEDLGADEVLLVPTSDDADEVLRAADVIASLG
jgi:alkanesulfonate monooxygenase SsuD/methylene tetrahydromethanopterin reductase-like flavin-dependent oxidoreductase (luciferase family)